jgi:hypothetical protein
VSLQRVKDLMAAESDIGFGAAGPWTALLKSSHGFSVGLPALAV